MNENIIFNSEKFKTMIHYIINRCESQDNFARVVLYKLLYFADFNNYEIYEKPISGETYIRKSMGPVPLNFHEAIHELKNEGKIDETLVNALPYDKFEYSSLKEPNIDLLSPEEVEVIDYTIDKISYLYSKKISEYSHGDIPWRLANDMEELNYESVFYRDPEYSVRDYDD